MALAEPFDLGAQVLLGVEPGSGHASFTADGVEGDALAGGVHAAQRGDGALAGLLSPELGSLDDMVRVISPHRRPRISRLWRSRRSSCRGWWGPPGSSPRRRAGPC